MPENIRRRLAGARGWLIPAALLAFAPKCLLCLLAYAGLGAALGLGGPELCGAAADVTGRWAACLAALGAAAGVAVCCARPTGPSPAGRTYKTTGRSASQPRSE